MDKQIKCSHCKSANTIYLNGDVVVNGLFIGGESKIYCKSCKEYSKVLSDLEKNKI